MQITWPGYSGALDFRFSGSLFTASGTKECEDEGGCSTQGLGCFRVQLLACRDLFISEIAILVNASARTENLQTRQVDPQSPITFCVFCSRFSGDLYMYADLAPAETSLQDSITRSFSLWSDRFRHQLVAWHWISKSCSKSSGSGVKSWARLVAGYILSMHNNHQRGSVLSWEGKLSGSGAATLPKAKKKGFPSFWVKLNHSHMWLSTSLMSHPHTSLAVITVK